jgi:hypothetical protein
MVVQTDRPVNLALFDQQLNRRAILLRCFYGCFEFFSIEGDVVDRNDLSFCRQSCAKHRPVPHHGGKLAAAIDHGTY